VLFLVLLSAGSSSRAEVFLFDMGTDQSALRPGFTRITPKSLYQKETGYGWKSAEGLKAHDRHYSGEWQFNERRGTSQPPPTYTNEITCDAVFSSRPNSFLVNVPPGEYVVYLLGGVSAGSPREYHDFEVAVGGERTAVKIPGPYTFEKRQWKTTVRSGPLSVDLVPRTDWVVSCLMVFSVSAEQKVRAEVLGPLEREIDFLPPDVAAKWKETKHTEDRALPDFSPADRRRGYALFARHWSEVIYPNTAPRTEELTPLLKTFASLGEYEPVTFTVHPLTDLHRCQVTASALRCGSAAIPSSALDIRSVRYMLVRPNYSSFFSYHVAPDVLEHRASLDLTRGCNQRYWITIKVPEDARPGVYEGQLTFRPDGAPAAEIPLKLRVLPILLRTNPDHIYGMYYHDPLSQCDDRNSALANDYFRRKAEWERRDMVEHGMNTLISSVTGLKRDDSGTWTIDGAETERRIALDRKFGLAGKPLVVHFPVEHWYTRLVDRRGLGSHLRLVRTDVPESFFAEVTKMVRVIEGERQRRGWPEFLYYPIDEPSTHEPSVRFMVGVLRAIKQVPGVRTYVTADPSHDQFAPLWPYVDVWCCQPFVFGQEKIQQLSRAKHIEFWCYPNHISGENDHTPVRGARMTWGFGFWKSGFKTLIPWIYQASVGNPWNYLDGSAMDFMNRSTPEGQPIPVALWEAFREGIDDGRYVYSLAQRIEEAKRKGGKAAELARQAEQDLKYVWEAIEVQEKYKYDRLWAGADFDAYRWLLAARICELQEALAR
jgi:hypothetical protein